MENKLFKSKYDKTVYLLQGGGALGAYQVGVCEGLLEMGCDPDWIIGTSIGAINGAIIAGNEPKNRIKKLKQFWDIICSTSPETNKSNVINDKLHKLENIYHSEWSMLFGVPGFFKLRIPPPFMGMEDSLDKLSLYDTTELQKTLESVIDFEILNSRKVRLTLSSVCIEDGILVKFDNTKQEISSQHIMASAALAPWLPAVKINGKNYWDGAIISNTPLEAISEEDTPQKILCFVVNLFSLKEDDPHTFLDVIKRKKDLELSSHFHAVTNYFYDLQRMQHTVRKLYALVPESERSPELKKICEFHHPTALNIVRFHYMDHPYDLWTKDFEFSARSYHERLLVGYNDVKKAFLDPSWLELIPEGIQTHNF